MLWNNGCCPCWEPVVWTKEVSLPTKQQIWLRAWSEQQQATKVELKTFILSSKILNNIYLTLILEFMDIVDALFDTLAYTTQNLLQANNESSE